MTARRMHWLALALALCMGATAAAASETTWGKWAESARKDHPLAGDYYAVTELGGGPGRGRFPPSHHGPALRMAPGKRPYIILLGEVHDNPAHHQVRAWLIENTARTFPDWRPAIVFEQIRSDQQPVLDKFKALSEAGDASATADELLRRLEWDKSGWPSGQIYKPLFAAAIAAKLPIYAGDPPRDRLRSVAKDGLSAVPADERARVRLETLMPQPLLAGLGAELAEGHCGTLPSEAIEGMTAAQRYHDALLADALLAAAERHGSAILIAGNGHVRSDWGVPWYIRERVPQAEVVSLMMMETEAGKTDPAAYVPFGPEGRPVADILVFTPKAARGDPCQELLKKKG